VNIFTFINRFVVLFGMMNCKVAIDLSVFKTTLRVEKPGISGRALFLVSFLSFFECSFSSQLFGTLGLHSLPRNISSDFVQQNVGVLAILESLFI
jgi:hypothetical protein